MFSELYKITVNTVTFASFRGGDRLNRTPGRHVAEFSHLTPGRHCDDRLAVT